MSGPALTAETGKGRQRIAFYLRLFSTCVLWALVLGTIFSGFELGFFLMVSGLGLLGLWEYYRMLEKMGLPCFRVFGMICGAASFIGSFYYFRTFGPGRAYDFEIGVLLFFLIAVFARQMAEKARVIASLESMVYTLFGLIYIVWMFNFTTKLTYVFPAPEGVPVGESRVTGHYFVLYLVAVTKFSDVGAYVFGSLFGRHQIVPHISPKKTWEGFFGALFSSTLLSCSLYLLLPEQLALLGWLHSIILGILLGFGAVIGDLAESIVKRSTNSKDSSNLLPGIGGALDLIDSLLFTAPLLFFYLRLVLRVGVS